MSQNLKSQASEYVRLLLSTGMAHEFTPDAIASACGDTHPADSLSDVRTGSPFFVVRLRGGTVLKLEARRAPDAQFDRLFSLLDECEVWQSPTDWDAAPSMHGKWISGKRAMAGACTSESYLMPQYTANTAGQPRGTTT